MKQKNVEMKRIVLIALSFAFIFLFHRLPILEGLTSSQKQVMGTFVGVLILWLTVAIDWPSVLCIGALALIPELNMKGILSASFGNATFAFLMFTFLCTYALSETPFIRRCALGFTTSRFAKKSSWSLVTLFFVSILFVGSFISPTVLFIIYLPIIEEMYSVLKLEKGSSTASMLMIGLVICTGISSGMTPIAHVFPLMAMDFYSAATEATISYTSYMAFAIPVGILSFAVMMLIFKYIFKPNLKEMANVSLDEMKSELEPMDKKEKTTLFVFFLVVLLWVLPDLVKPLLPEFAAAMNSLGTAFPPLLGVIALSILTYEGKPLLNFSQAMAKGVPWGALIMAAGTLALGSALSNPDIGLTDALGNAIAPVATNMAPLAMVFLFALWTSIQTNLSSNMVTVTVVSSIAIPVTLATNGMVSASAVASIVGALSAYAFAFPPAMPSVALAGASGWTSSTALAKYGSLIALTSTIIAVLVGYPIASVLMP